MPLASSDNDDHPPRRPDFSTFFSHVDAYTDTSQSQNPHAQPLPQDMSSAYRLLAEGFERMRQDGGESGEGVLDGMISLLLRESEAPPGQVEGVGQEFVDGEFHPVPQRSSKVDKLCHRIEKGEWKM